MIESTSEKVGKTAAVFLGCAFLIVLLIYVPIVNAFVLTKLWAWFIVKTFNLPQISKSVAYGISLIVTLLTVNLSALSQNKTADDNSQNVFYTIILSPWMILLAGWVVYSMFM